MGLFEMSGLIGELREALKNMNDTLQEIKVEMVEVNNQLFEIKKQGVIKK